ncbi:hypothetical protein SUGI_0434790 [Cryptomeria japonica]|uniref:uncharacterized protein LOC131061805 n=1 Tax=Cryptomeria japonica TaxID=3369 RepID=UPI00240897C2|nr:uncharacterized protein LOC131061805 [Cryptomeria japonica]GLJ23040.1 hypothetical protein SUGI_0434790 [Cryptomeria japonica]
MALFKPCHLYSPPLEISASYKRNTRECMNQLTKISAPMTSKRFNSSVWSLKVSCSVKSEILSKVQMIVAKHLAIDPNIVKPNSNWDDLGIDSLEAGELMLGLEQEFNICMDPVLFAKVTTPQEAANVVHDTKQNIKQ